jgi:hypothetical protein
VTNAELLDLLREASACVVAVRDDDLAKRIDAALAEGCPDCCHSHGYLDYCQGNRHAESRDSATDVVEWNDLAGQGIQIAKVGDLTLRLVFHSYPPAWRWSVSHDRQDYGECFTEDEAKIAAIAAARGMR